MLPKGLAMMIRMTMRLGNATVENERAKKNEYLDTRLES